MKERNQTIVSHKHKHPGQNKLREEEKMRKCANKIRSIEIKALNAQRINHLTQTERQTHTHTCVLLSSNHLIFV